MARSRSPYDVLGIAPGSEDVVVRAAYRALMQKYHPDKAGEGIKARERAREINEAYEVLGDPARRAKLDADLSAVSASRASIDAGVSPRHLWIAAGVLLSIVAIWMVLFADRHRSEHSEREVARLTRSPQGQAPAVPIGPPVVSTNTILQWSEQDQPDARYKAGELELQFGTRDTNVGRIPVLTIIDESGRTHEMSGSAGFDQAAAKYAVGQIDSQADGSQVLFLTFSGGAHCCTRVQLAERINGHWRTLELGEFDGDQMEFPRDLGGSPSLEFTFRDDRFLYAFAAYAMSPAPSLILSVEGGAVHDVSSSAGHRRAFKIEMSQLEQACRERSNGGCAAYVASAARANRLSQAWRVMLDNYDAQDDWPLPPGCRIVTEGECPEAAVVRYLNYPEALQAFLGRLGYISATYVEPLDHGDRPSFSCARVTSAVLKLVCNDPRLAASDRRLAVAYARALAFSRDREQLQLFEQRFISARNSLPADVELVAAAYEAQIRNLELSLGRW